MFLNIKLRNASLSSANRLASISCPSVHWTGNPAERTWGLFLRRRRNPSLLMDLQ